MASTELRYARLIERVGYGVYRSTADGRLLEVNSALARMLGYASPDELLTLDLARDVYLDPRDRDRLRGRPAPFRLPEWVATRWKRQDGSPINVRLCVHRHAGPDGSVDEYEGLVEDITERERREELLRRSERMASLGSTLAGVAHELNNPLAAIMGFTQLLLKKSWQPDDQAALETINHEAIRSAAIVKDLLALTRTRDTDQRAPTDVNDIVGYIVRTRRYALETTGVTCTMELQPALPAVLGDRTHLEQVVLNLLTNAEHAVQTPCPSREAEAGAGAARSGDGSGDGSGGGGGGGGGPPRIILRTRLDGAEVVIEVEDNGPGVPEEIRSKIWDPFWTTKEEGEGTGLGLSIAHSICADHGGTIALDSAAAGARFVVRLPVAAEPRAESPPTRAPRPLDVLVVDPGASDLVFVERFLTARGHAVLNAGSGELALRLAEQSSFDAVVCDARLVGRDGTPVATALHERRGCAGARFVLAVVPGAEARHGAEAIQGATFMARPYDVEVLRRLIEGD